MYFGGRRKGVERVVLKFPRHDTHTKCIANWKENNIANWRDRNMLKRPGYVGLNFALE